MVKVIDLFHESGTELAHFFNPVGIVSLVLYPSCAVRPFKRRTDNPLRRSVTMKTAMAMLALVLGLSFSSATFVQADEMKKEAAPAAAAPAAPAAPAGEVKKEEGKKKGKKHGKKKGEAKKEEAAKQ
jgi:glucose dehydrogenase